MARKILLADDSVTAQNMGRKILTDAGYEVITVNNGSAALKKIAEHKPDLIVLDVYMPGYSGLEVCQRIKENRETARIPVLLTVGKLEPFKPEEARRARADAFVVKPFEASELLAAITKLEDKVIPAPEPYKQGRFAKAVAAFDRDTDSEKSVESDEGWKARLRIPSGSPKPRESEPDADYAATQGKGFRDIAEMPGKKDQPKTSESHFERPLPTGLPQDITPEEIAAFTAAAAQLSGVAAATSTARQTTVDDKAETPTETGVEIGSQGSDSNETAPVTFASAPGVAGAQAETISSQIPVEEAAAQEAVPVEASSSEMASHPAEPSASEPAELESVGAVEESKLEAPPEIVATPVEESSEAAVVAEMPEAGSAGIEEATPVIEAAVPLANAPAAPEPTPAENDDEVMAALQTLIPSVSAAEPLEPANAPPQNENGSAAFAAAAATADLGITQAHAAGPRWIAEEVSLATEDAAVSLEREMEKAYAAVSAAGGPMAAVDAMVQASDSAPAAFEGAMAAPEVQPGDHPVVYPMASAAAVGDSSAGAIASASQTPVVHELPSADSAVYRRMGGTHEAPELESGAVESTVAPAEEMAESAIAPSEMQVVAADTSIENEIVGGTEMAANWKNIRDSVAGAAAKPAPAKEEFHEAEPATSEPEATPAVSERVSSRPAATDPSAIASIVDSVLAELRPRIVEEIARKLADSKKE